MTTGWWVMSDDHLRALLERAQAGEDVGILLAETYANSDSEDVEGA